MRFRRITPDQARAMYAGGRANDEARWYARLWTRAFRLGLMPRRWVVLEVVGRRSRRIVEFPLGMADHQGSWYLVSMLGENCNVDRRAPLSEFGRVAARYPVFRVEPMAGGSLP